jgi:hypothetical protein
MADLGVRLQLLVGPTVARPAPYDVVDALQSVEVTNRDHERDGFQLTFHVAKDSLIDYQLLREGHFEPPARVSVIVIFAGAAQVLINGMVTDLQLVPSNRPGESTFHVTGEDLGLELAFAERSVVFRNQSDSEIVESILGNYGLEPDVTATTDRPTEQQRVVSQQGTDLAFVQKLAEDNRFMFFVEPSGVPGVSRAYWGPERRTGPPQPALTLSAGPEANVDQPITFGFDALAAASPQVTILEPSTGLRIQVPVPADILSQLSRRPAAALRTVVARDTAKLDPVQAGLRAQTASASAGDASSGRGEVDAVRYGRALRSRQLVDVGGAGGDHDGTYYVREVTHHIQRGSYRQSFTILREGRGATSPRVVR